MTMRRMSTAAVATALIVAACAPANDARPTDDSAAATAVANGDVAIVVNAEPVRAGTIRFTVAGTGNTARYRVRERLMGNDLDNDAIGETSEITGAIAVDSATGALIAGQSKFVVGTGAFKSDKDRRDGYVRGRLLESTKFPTVELSPTSVRGLPAGAAAISAAGPITFELIGDLTVRGVTRPTTWRVTARQAGGRVTGTASTRFTFADFTMTQPKVPIVLSVADTIGLEYDFTLVRETAPR